MADKNRSEELSAKNGGSNELHICQVRREDLCLVQQWMYDEDWTSVNLVELESWFDLYPHNFLAIYDTNSQIQAHIFARILAPGTTLIEMFIVRPESRGKGIGTKLLHHVTSQHENCVLVAVPGKEPFYEARGFKLTGQTMLRFSGMSTNEVKVMDSKVKVTSFHGDDTLVSRVIDYDVSVHGMDRAALIRMYSTSDKCICLSATENDQITGFLVIRIRDDLAKIIAFCAQNPEIAEALLLSALPQCKDKQLRVSFPSGNIESGSNLYERIFEKIEKKSNNEMYLSTTGAIDEKINWSKIYGVTELDYMGFF